MLRKVGIRELSNDASSIVGDVQACTDSVVITNRGEAAALLVPLTEKAREVGYGVMAFISVNDRLPTTFELQDIAAQAGFPNPESEGEAAWPDQLHPFDAPE